MKYEIKRFKGGLCKYCGKPESDLRIDIQVSNFRGDDDVFRLHKECFEKIKNNIEVLYE